MSDFTDQYKHPLWQKRRLEMLERAKFRCSSCRDLDNANTKAGGWVGDGVNTEAYLADPITWEAGRVAAAAVDLPTIFDIQDAAKSLVNATAMRSHSDGNATQSPVVMRGGFS